MEKLWDLISVSLTFPFIYCALQYIETYDSFWILLEFGTIFVLITTELIKLLLKPYGFNRPKGATKCDILCQKGSAEDQSGMPSGHMSVCAFFAMCLWIHYGKKQLSLVAYIAALFLVACARYFKRCHTIAQIIAGVAYGGTCAYVFCNIKT